MAKKTGMELAVEAVGSQIELSRRTKISKSFINKMCQRGIASPSRCQAIHKATGVPLEKLNPKVYASQ